MELGRAHVAKLRVVVMVCEGDGVGVGGRIWEPEGRGSEDIEMERSGGQAFAVSMGGRGVAGSAWGGGDGGGDACECLQLPWMSQVGGVFPLRSTGIFER